MTEDCVTHEMCELRRQVITTRVNGQDTQIDGILDEIREVRNLQKTILYTLIFISIGVACTLMGVVLGRGIDFGWLIP